MRRSLVFLAFVLLPSSATAQRRLDFTGKPSAVIAEPFSLISGVRELAGNRAVVTDQMDHTLLLVDFTTGKSSRIGRQGEGPGEYRFPTAPLAAPGDTTWVGDPALRRIDVVSPGGAIVAALEMPTGGLSAGLLSARGTDRLGRLYFEENSFDQNRGGFSDTVAVVRWNPATRSAEVVTRVWSGGRVTVKRPDGLASYARGMTPFPHLDAWAVLPDGAVAVVHHDPFRIDVAEVGGSLRRGAPISVTPMPVTDADRTAWRERAAGNRSTAVMKGGGSGPPAPGTQFADAQFPGTMPPFVASAVLATPEGELWIGRSHGAGDRTWRYDIFDRQGVHLGAATLSVHSVIVGFGAGTVYLARTDPADDLVYLERYRR